MLEEVMDLKSVFRKHKLLLLAVLLGISAAIATYAAISPFVATAPAVIAVKEIGQYCRVGAGDVRVAELPLKSLPKTRFESAQDVIGSYAASRILAGQTLMKGHVTKGAREAGLSADTPSEMRCVFVPAGLDRAVGGFIKKGELVDAVFTPKSPAHGSFPGTAAPSPIRALRVLEVCSDPSSRGFFGVVVLARREDAEFIARCIESCAVSLLLSARDVSAESAQEAWRPK